MSSEQRQQISKRLKTLVNMIWFPILYAINSVAFFYFTYKSEATSWGLVIITVVTLLVVGFAWFLFHLLLGDLQKSAILVFVFSSLFFSFQNIVHNLRVVSIRLSSNELLRFWHSNLGQWLVFLLIIVTGALIFLMIKKVNQVHPIMIPFLNIFCMLLLTGTLIRGYLSFNRYKLVRNNFIDYWENEHLRNIPLLDVDYDEKPDVYYIILDGFPRSDILAELYDLDNSDFITELADRGFYIAMDSYANYTQTRSSLASSLNMTYLVDAADVLGEDTNYYYPAYHMIHNSSVEKIFRELGYEMVSFSSLISYTDLKSWDTYLSPRFMPDSFSQTYISTTGLSVFLNPQLYRWHHERIDYFFHTVPDVGLADDPQFVFAHLLSPHPPFIYNRDGTLKRADRLFTTQDANYFFSSGTVDEYQIGYQDQVIHLQNQLIDMIDRILITSKRPFLLVIQADHGSGMQLDQTDLKNTNIKERLGIFNAYFFHDQNYDMLYQGISPVNTFRVILTQYFGLDKPLITDHFYYSEYWNLFNFTSVDDLLD